MLTTIQNQLPITILEHYLVRYIKPDDKEDLFQMYSNEKIAKYVVTGKTHTSLEDTESFIELIYNRMKAGNNLYLGICDKTSQRLIGIIRFLEKEDPSTVTIGYALNEQYWGQGIIPSVLNEVFKLVILEGRYSRVRATVRLENLKSQRCLEKLGFEFAEKFVKEDSSETDKERLLYYKKLK